jgi:MoaA/NifB/PqqE/SkfB family radical SAM enzyme
MMGDACDSRQIIENVLAFNQLIRRKRVRTLDLRVSYIVTRANVGELDKVRRFWRGHGIRLVTSALENRGGNITGAGTLNPYDMAPVLQCTRPTRDLCILWNGDVILCCVDWWRTTILGNVGRDSIRGIWTGKKVSGIREAILYGEKADLPEVCRRCAQSANPNAHRKSLKSRLLRLFR